MSNNSKRILLDLGIIISILTIIASINSNNQILTFFSTILIIFLFVKRKQETKKENEIINNEYLNFIKQHDLKEILNEKKIYIYVNEKSKKWSISNQKKIYKFKDVIQCEIIEDGTTVTNTTSKNHISLGKAVIGGSIFGPVGAIVGGLSGKTSSFSSQQNICKSLSIKITLNDLENPCLYINLINSKLSKDSKKYKEIKELSEKIVSIFQIIIDNK